MTYVSQWERLSDAIKRIMEAVGCSKEEAQTDLSRAIADRVIRLRARPKRHTTTRMTSRTVLEGNVFDIPTNIRPSGLDWEKSRPVKPWVVRRGSFAPHGYWDLEYIELSRPDVTKVLCVKEAKRSKSSPTLERTQRAIKELFPQEVPDQAALPNALLCRRVSEKLKNSGLGDVSDDTILRAAGRRKYRK